MKLQTKDLTDRALDWAVAVCEGALYPLWPAWSEFRPSSNPEQAWPIIHREKISILWWESTQRWGARIGFRYEMFGSNGLQAAMRAFVEFKLGREVEIPDELIPPKLRRPEPTHT